VLKKRKELRGRIERFRLDSDVLKGNALGDPHRRDVTVYLPPEYDRRPEARFPVFVDLVGFMGSGRAHLNWKAFEETVPERLERLARRGEIGPVVAVFPDCWTRLGGNQYINSSAVGRYADYLLKEILPEIDRRYRTFGDSRRRAVFGKSSGGYGAIIHGMKYARHWGAVACHSGDMYFDFCYRNDIPRVLDSLAKHRRDPSRFIREFYARRKVGMGDTMTLMFLAMAAFYDPDPKAPLGFHLPMDLCTGEVDERRWSRWLRHDPVHLVERESVRRQLGSLRGVFIDCGSRDQFHLHYGARILHDRLRTFGIGHRYEEFDDDHSAVDYRMDVSLPWLYAKVMGRRPPVRTRGRRA
jgi:enterochelin esterase-like enzyme